MTLGLVYSSPGDIVIEHDVALALRQFRQVMETDLKTINYNTVKKMLGKSCAEGSMGTQRRDT